jgi:hypothetical protein
MNAIAGLTPSDWESRLEKAAGSPDTLAPVLDALRREMSQETTWLHDHPSPDGMLSAVLGFFGRQDDDDVAALAAQLEWELQRERSLLRRYRGWRPNETWYDRLAPYLKSIEAHVAPTDLGLQFPGYLKVAGTSDDDAATFFLSEMFPGRDPANFHVTADAGTVVLKRIYKMDLPRLDGGRSTARAVLAEMIMALVGDTASILRIVVDNAANRETRQALLTCVGEGNEAAFVPVPNADPARTILGHLMLRLAAELGRAPGALSFRVLPFGMLRLELPVA